MARGEGPNLDRLYSIKVDGSRNHLHPADVRGRFVRRRRLVYAVLIAIYVLLPLVKIGGKPAVHLDIAARRFYLFGATFNSQDFWLVVFLLTTVGFGLLFFTAWLGRVWCGWACPQTVFLEGVYRRIERWIDGPGEARRKLAAAPWTAGKLGRRIAKHAAFLAVSFFLAHVFLSFFVSLPGLLGMMAGDPRDHLVAFAWVMAITGLLYFNFAWFREQLCIIICPYGRLQSVLTDKHSLIIGYDRNGGEPRGHLVRGAAWEGRGDCIDCGRCVAVCPTGIDIRNGSQLECIGCAQCVDACDEVMDKVGRPRGLVRYDSLKGLAGEKKKVLRPRLVFYGVLLTAAVSGLTLGLGTRTPFEANLLRVRGAPYLLVDGGVRNQFELHLINKNPAPTTFRIALESPVPAEFTVASREIPVGSLQSFRLPIFVTVDEADYRGPFELELEVVDGASGRERELEVRFLGPHRLAARGPKHGHHGDGHDGRGHRHEGGDDHHREPRAEGD
jgi:cytochrome c oxidase accessory protein FixG